MRCFDKILYHSTAHQNVPSILIEGLKPTYLGNSIICMSPKPEIAENFGEVVLEVNTGGYDISCFDDCAEWERFVWTENSIPPSKIKVIKTAEGG